MHYKALLESVKAPPRLGGAKRSIWRGGGPAILGLLSCSAKRAAETLRGCGGMQFPRSLPVLESSRPGHFQPKNPDQARHTIAGRLCPQYLTIPTRSCLTGKMKKWDFKFIAAESKKAPPIGRGFEFTPHRGARPDRCYWVVIALSGVLKTTCYWLTAMWRSTNRVARILESGREAQEDRAVHSSCFGPGQ